MTSAPHVPRLAFEDIDDAIDALRARGLRLSTTRQLVLDALFAASAPLSAEEIAVRLHLVATSVYRGIPEELRTAMHGRAGWAVLGAGRSPVTAPRRFRNSTAVSESNPRSLNARPGSTSCADP